MWDPMGPVSRVCVGSSGQTGLGYAPQDWDPQESWGWECQGRQGRNWGKPWKEVLLRGSPPTSGPRGGMCPEHPGFTREGGPSRGPSPDGGGALPASGRSQCGRVRRGQAVASIRLSPPRSTLSQRETEVPTGAASPGAGGGPWFQASLLSSSFLVLNCGEICFERSDSGARCLLSEARSPALWCHNCPVAPWKHRAPQSPCPLLRHLPRQRNRTPRGLLRRLPARVHPGRGRCRSFILLPAEKPSPRGCLVTCLLLCRGQGCFPSRSRRGTRGWVSVWRV